MSTFSLTVSTTVVTSLTMPLASITSVLASAESALSKEKAALETATATASLNSLSEDISELSASVSYYSILGMQATATDEAVIASLASEAAVASAVSEQIYEENSFFNGNKPNRVDNLVMLIVFAILLGFQVVLGVFYRQRWFLFCFSTGLVLEVVGYAGRIKLHFDIRDLGSYVMQYSCLTIGPCLLMAGIYQILAQLTVVMGKRYSLLKPAQYTPIFVVCNMSSVIVQATGGGMVSNASGDSAKTRNAQHVLEVGVALQLASMTIFQIFWFVFVKRCYESYREFGDAAFEPKYKQVRARITFRPFFTAVTLAVLFIYVRTIYRLVEMSQGFDSNLVNDETYFLVLDGLMVGLAALLLTVCHPGIAYGRHSGIKMERGFKHLFTRKTEHYKETGPLGLDQETGTVSVQQETTALGKHEKDEIDQMP